MISFPKISVVLICYNHERFISEAINSILTQTYTDFELIIVDDGSVDNTLNIIHGFKDQRIIIVEQENSGPSIAINNGIEHSRGQFIAFMSGDDISLPNRLMTQIEQIEIQQADLLFCLPQIIGPNSKIIDNNICPWFFQRDFNSTAELFYQLFYSGNFLCAPSCFCRRTAIEKVGWFKRGLIQLQDFDYWIRACKQNLVIKLQHYPVLNYRYMYGENLSSSRNKNRTEIETVAIYRSFFDKAPVDLLHEAFGEKITLEAIKPCPDIELDKSFLFLEHSNPMIKAIGIQRIIFQLEDNEIYEKLKYDRGLDTAKLFQLTKATNLGGFNLVKKVKKGLISIRNILVRNLRFVFTEGPRWTDDQIKQRISYYLEKGDHKRAIMVAHGYRKFPPGPTLFATFLKVYEKIFVKKIFTPMLKVVKIIFSKIRSILLKIKKRLVKIRNKYIPQPVLESVFTLSRMYDYGKQNNCIVYEEPLEKIRLKKPKVIGSIIGKIDDGEVFSLREYVSIVNHAVITGGSNLVITQTGDLLSDEMVDFPTDDFGIKSSHISFRDKNNIILRYKKKTKTSIKEGILLSCDHDNNYFHWLVEVLPKLLFIDTQEQFKDVPLLIPDGLHENLMVALDLVNIYDHPIIILDEGVAYAVDRLIFPSALSRIVDRYRGNPVFGIDMVLSQKWLPQIADLLKKDEQNTKKPWRKIYLTRRKGLRALGNQEEIERVLRKRRFEIVDLDGLSLNSQIELFSEVSVIVAPTGAALTNMLLCQPGTKVIIFMADHESTNYYFWSYLGDVAKLDVKIIAGQRLFKVTNYWSLHDDYAIDLDILLEQTSQIMKDE